MSTGVSTTRPDTSGATFDDSTATKLPVASIVTRTSLVITDATETTVGGWLPQRWWWFHLDRTRSGPR